MFGQRKSQPLKLQSTYFSFLIMNIEDEKTIQPVPMKGIKTENGQFVGVTKTANSEEDEASFKFLKQTSFKKMAQLREQESYLLEILNRHEMGERDEVLTLLRKRKNLDEFFLFFLDYLETPKNIAKAGGYGKNASLMPYVARAKRYYAEQKIANGGICKQIPFAVDFLEIMANEYEEAMREVSELKKQAAILEKELNAIDFRDRKKSNQAESLSSIKERIRILERHPPPVSEDTVVRWITGIQ